MKIWNVPDSVAQAAKAQAPGLGPNPVAEAGAPIALTSELGSITAGRSAVFPVLGLQPGFRTPYWIDEVRIVVAWRTDPGVSYEVAPALRFFFNTGSYQISKTPIPSMLYSQIYGYDESTTGARISATLQRYYSTFRWVLPKPLYMPAGDVLQCSVTRDVTLAASQVMVGAYLSYVGRACAPGEAPPPCRHIPWVAYYRHPNTSSYSTTNDEFRNPVLKPLMIQRLVARMAYTGEGGAANQGLIGPPGNYVSQGFLPTNASATYISATIQDSLGYLIVPTMTPIGAIIDPMRGVWTFNRALSAREQLSMAFQTTGSTGDYDAYVSMIGYREEPV